MLDPPVTVRKLLPSDPVIVPCISGPIISLSHRWMKK